MRWVVGILLVGAAVLKAVQLASDPAVILINRLGSLFPVQIGLEFGIGLVVLSGLYWQKLRWIAVLLFTAFAVHSVTLAFGGAETCGCFGVVRIHPLWTLILDVLVVFGLLLAPSGGTPNSMTKTFWTTFRLESRQNAIATVMALSTVIVATLALYANVRSISADGAIRAEGEIEVLEPDRWIGKRLPIAEFIDLDISIGDWIVLLHRHDCPHCKDAVPQYERLASTHPNSQVRIALVEIPPFDNESEAFQGACRYGRLRDDHRWFIETPVEIQLKNGVVTSASTALPALVALSNP